ncbi:MAG: VOC family protein [Bacteroidetes bacterium]|nr:VOC family protein [Bacteroidota bacterium]
MFQKLRTIIYHTPDLAKTKEWYASLTGAQPYFDQPFYVGFDINGYELGLDPNAPKPTGPGAVAYWRVENIRDAVARCTETGATIYSDIQNVGGTIEVAIVIDPFGNHIGLISE